jgi:hypothetical protein
MSLKFRIASTEYQVTAKVDHTLAYEKLQPNSVCQLTKQGQTLHFTLQRTIVQSRQDSAKTL